MAFDDTRARAELGYTSRPAGHALDDSARWFVEHGYVEAPRAAQIRWNPPGGVDALTLLAGLSALVGSSAPHYAWG